MRYIKYLYYCAKVVRNERKNKDVRAKRRRIARNLEKLREQFGIPRSRRYWV